MRRARKSHTGVTVQAALTSEQQADAPDTGHQYQCIGHIARQHRIRQMLPQAFIVTGRGMEYGQDRPDQNYRKADRRDGPAIDQADPRTGANGFGRTYHPTRSMIRCAVGVSSAIVLIGS